MKASLRNTLRFALVLVAAITAASAAATAQASIPRAWVNPAPGHCQGLKPCYRSIQVAINRSAPGTVIVVRQGIYREHVLLNKRLTLRGRSAIIDGGGTGTLLKITASGAVVRTLALRNGFSGVQLSGATANHLATLRIGDVGQGILFSSGSTGNLVTDANIRNATNFAVDVSDQGSSGNQFLRLKLHDSATGLSAYRGSDNLVLKDSSIWGIAPGPAVVIGWSNGWTIQHNEIVGSSTGILTDTVRSGSIAHNYIAHNSGNGIEEAGYYSTVATHDNRIEKNGRSGIALCIAARNNEVRHNMVVDNARYGIEICAHQSQQYWNTGNNVSGNYLFMFSGTGMLGDALDDQGSNNWSGNYYSLNQPWSAPFTIPGAVAAKDPGPLTQANLPKAGTASDCRNDGWWLLTDGHRPFESDGACVKFTGAALGADRDCSDFATQRSAQIFFLNHGGPRRDPDRLDADHDGIACESNPCPCYYKTHLPRRKKPGALVADRAWRQ